MILGLILFYVLFNVLLFLSYPHPMEWLAVKKLEHTMCMPDTFGRTLEMNFQKAAIKHVDQDWPLYWAPLCIFMWIIVLIELPRYKSQM